MTVEPTYIYRATCDRVIDGDTYDLLIDLGFRTYQKVRVRLRGADCPELPTPEGITARHKAIELLATPQLVVQSYKDHRTFERWVCDIWINSESLADTLIAEGVAKPA